jgi:hypothetical protein
LALGSLLLIVALLGGVVLLALAISAYESRWAALEAQRAEDAAAAAAARSKGLPQIAEIQRAFEVMQLITMVLETKVTSTSADESWRGDVKATVQSRARLLYGVDLAAAKLEHDTVGVLDRLTIRIAPPRKLASELVGTPAAGEDVPEVELGWLRFRTRAGEYHVGEARRLLPQAVALMKLSTKDAEMVREQTAERVRELTRMFVGPEVLVRVEFEEPKP